MDFNDQPRDKTTAQIGPLVIELGERQRTCRGCRTPIHKGTYHGAIWLGDAGASLKFCEACLMAAAQWCKLRNRRNP